MDPGRPAGRRPDVIALGIILIVAVIAFIPLAVRSWRKAGRTLDAILAEARGEDPE